MVRWIYSARNSFCRGEAMRWILIIWVFVLSAVAYLDRVNISIAGQAISLEFRLDNVHLGWVFSAFVLGYALFQAPGGRLADRFGARKVLTAGVLWWGVFTALITIIPSDGTRALAWLLAVRFLLGAGEAVVYPASNRLVANWIPSGERGIANGLIFAGVGVGAGITPPLITSILLNYGWRWSFWVSAAIGFGAGLVWYLLARDTPQEHPWASDAERAHIAAGLPESPKQLESAPMVPWKTILTSKDVAAITVSYFIFGYAAYIFFTWFFIYLSTVRGLNLKTSSYYSMLPFIGMAICSPLGGRISDAITKHQGKRVGRCGVAGVSLLLAALFIALGTLARSAELASVVLACGAGALYLSISSFWSVSADLAGPAAGSVSGIMNMGCQIGGAVTASLTPVIANHFGWGASFLTAAALCALGALPWLVVDPEHRLRSAPAAPQPIGS